MEADSHQAPAGPLRRGVAYVRRPSTLRRLRLAAIAFVALLVLLALLVPVVARSVLTGSVATSLNRQVSVGSVRFNPLTLTLYLYDLHVADRDPAKPFVDAGRVALNLSFTSLFRLAPVLDELTVDAPVLHVARDAEGRFNYADLLEPVPADASAEPARYVLANIAVSSGRILFDDRMLDRSVAVEKIEVGVPFLANLPSKIHIFVEPLLAFEVDGHPQRIEGKTKPYAETLESVLDFHLNDVDLPRLFAYVADMVPVRVVAGTVSGALQLRFTSGKGKPQVGLNGTLVVDGLEVHDAADAPLLAWRHLQASLADVQPLRNYARVNALALEAPTVALQLAADRGVRNPLAARPARAPAAAEPAAKGKPAEPEPDWDVGLGVLRLSEGTIHLSNPSKADPTASLEWDQLSLDATGLQTLGKEPGSMKLESRLAGGPLSVKGSVLLSEQRAQFDVESSGLDMTELQRVVRALPEGLLGQGKVGLSGKIEFGFGKTRQVRAEPARVVLDDVAMTAPGADGPPLAMKHAEIGIQRFDLAAQELALSSATLDGVAVRARRGKDGKLELLELLSSRAEASKAAADAALAEAPPAQPAPEPAQPAPEPPPTAEAKPWRLSVAEAKVVGATVHAEDLAPTRPVKLDIVPLDVTLSEFGPDFAKPGRIELGATFGSKGRLALSGTATLAARKAELAVQATGLDLFKLEPYADPYLNAKITSASFGAKGQLQLAWPDAGVEVHYRGNALLSKVRALDRASSDEFVRWEALSAEGVDVAAGRERPKVTVGSVSLANFYARVILRDNGRLNLQDIVVKGDQEAGSLTRDEHEAEPAAKPAHTEATVSTPSEAKPPAADIAIGEIALQGGSVNYSDYFIKPNFTADVTEIGGKVGAFGTASTEPAPLTLAGKLERTAPIAIEGRINPLAPTAFVDIKAKADGVELTRLSPYSTKYAGYPIEKGLLNVDVQYKLDQGKLTADNHIVISQLTFGPKVEGPDATSLPVPLAVSLLTDSEGRIDVNIPVSGSLDDPQFSLGGVIAKAFASALLSVITSPFKLLATMFGGHGGDAQELSYAEFEPGYARLTPATEQRLDTIAKALEARPKLTLDITGRVDPERDRQGLRDAKLLERMNAAKAAELGRKDESLDPATVAVTPEDSDKYLEQVYKDTDFPKPRNAIGMAKSLPPDEMRTLLLTHIEVDDAALRDLATRRADAVRAKLASRIDPGRLFVTAAKDDAGKTKDEAPTTRVDFALR